MPGMMDTILNLGLNEQVVEGLSTKSQNPRWAWDCYRRFIQMYSDVVMEVNKGYFEKVIDSVKNEKGVKLDTELTAEDLKHLAGLFKAEYKSNTGSDFPTDPKEQLMGAIKAVFRSWNNERAVYYRNRRGIYEKSQHRRKEADGRILNERSGRGCGGRCTHTRALGASERHHA